MKIDWKKLSCFRSLGREEMEGLLREAREKKNPAISAADYTPGTAGRDRKGR